MAMFEGSDCVFKPGPNAKNVVTAVGPKADTILDSAGLGQQGL